jgi:hypothetical protein
MQLLSTLNSYYIKSVRTILRICRKTAQITLVSHAGLFTRRWFNSENCLELAELDDWHILYNNVYGFIGKIVIDEVSWSLV